MLRSHFLQDVRHFEFISSENPSWLPGDVACITPRTTLDVVAATAAYLSVSLDDWVDIRPTEPVMALPESHKGPMQVRDLLENLVSPAAPPRRGTLSLLAHFTEDPAQAARLREMTTAAGQVLHYSTNYCYIAPFSFVFGSEMLYINNVGDHFYGTLTHQGGSLRILLPTSPYVLGSTSGTFICHFIKPIININFNLNV